LGCSGGNKDGKVHLKYWAVWSGFELEAMREVVNQFNQSQNRIVVDLLSISLLERKLLISTAGGNPPDVASLGYEFLPDFAQKNAILPLDGYIQREGISQDDFIPVFWEQCGHEGYTWGLPIMGSAIALHYNKAHFRSVGLDPDKPPVTIAELTACEDKLNILKDDQYQRLAFLPSVAVPEWWPYCWPWFFGGELWNGVDRLTLTDPKCVEAFQWVADFPTRLGPERVQPLRAGYGNLFASPQNPFLAGKLTMLFQGSWMANFVDKYAPELDFGAAPMSVKTPDLYGTVVVEADTMFIPSGVKHPEASFEFMKYVTSQEPNEKLCLGFRCISPKRVRSEHFSKVHPNPNIRMFDGLVMGNKTHYAPKMSMWNEMVDEMGVVFDQVWLHEETPLDALTNAQNRLQARLDQETDLWRLVAAARRKEWDEIVRRTKAGEPPQ
jgi:ABC-type glycerol-3-phosphate transport system substrate-binding protein